MLGNFNVSFLFLFIHLFIFLILQVAGSVVLDLNDDGLVAEIADVDDRRFGFTIHVPHSKK